MLIAIAFLTHGVWGRAIGHMRPYRGSGRGIRQRVTHISLDSRARTHHLDPASLGRPDEARPAPALPSRIGIGAATPHGDEVPILRLQVGYCGAGRCGVVRCGYAPWAAGEGYGLQYGIRRHPTLGPQAQLRSLLSMRHRTVDQ